MEKGMPWILKDKEHSMAWEKEKRVFKPRSHSVQRPKGEKRGFQSLWDLRGEMCNEQSPLELETQMWCHPP